MADLVVDVSGCARCGLSHRKLRAVPFRYTNAGWSHWAWCPTTSEPVMVKFDGTATANGSEMTTGDPVEAGPDPRIIVIRRALVEAGLTEEQRLAKITSVLE